MKSNASSQNLNCSSWAVLLLVSEQHRGIFKRDRLAGREPSLKTSQVFRDRMKIGTDGPEIIVIPAGKFRMGDIQEEASKSSNRYTWCIFGDPLRSAGMKSPFINTTSLPGNRQPITGRRRFRSGPSAGDSISWNEAVDYAAWLSKQTVKRYRLPTEAEWEYAARGGTETAYWWGNQMKPGLANCISCGTPPEDRQTAPVGSFKPNPFGLFDTAGNVREWVQDCWHDNYQGAPSDGSAWKKEHNGDCNGRVHRGGSFRGVNKGN